jgi:hypothetical protein
MDRWLVDTLNWINLLAAFAIMLFAAVTGASMIGGAGGFIAGAIIGFLVAALVCGTLATLCRIERHLRVLTGDTRRASAANSKWPYGINVTRIDPNSL